MGQYEFIKSGEVKKYRINRHTKLYIASIQYTIDNVNLIKEFLGNKYKVRTEEEINSDMLTTDESHDNSIFIDSSDRKNIKVYPGDYIVKSSENNIFGIVSSSVYDLLDDYFSSQWYDE